MKDKKSIKQIHKETQIAMINFMKKSNQESKN